MFQRDLIAKYGEGHGTTDVALRQALRARNIVFGGGGAIVGLGILALILFVPGSIEVLSVLAIVLGSIGISAYGIFYFIHVFPDHLRTIKNAKHYGVRETSK